MNLYRKIERIVVILLSVTLALSTINPFSIGTVGNDKEFILTTYLSILFMGLFLFDKFFLVKLSKLKRFAIILFSFFITILFSSLFSFFTNSVELNIIWFLKLLNGIILWIMLTLYFMREKKTLILSITFFSITCAFLIMLYQTGLLNPFLDIRHGRVFLFGENPNSTSSRIALALIFLMYFVFEDIWKLKNKRFWGMICVFLFLVYIFESGSRGTFIATIISIFIIFIFSPIKKGIKIKISLTTFFIGTFLFTFFSNISSGEYSMLERMDELNEGNERIQTMSNAIAIFVDNPVIGVGENGYMYEKMIRGFRLLDSHCIMTTILAMGGLVGCFLFCLFLWEIVKLNFLVIKKSVIPLVVFIYMLFISLKTGGVLTYSLMWYTYAVSYSLSYHYKNGQ